MLEPSYFYVTAKKETNAGCEDEVHDLPKKMKFHLSIFSVSNAIKRLCLTAPVRSNFMHYLPWLSSNLVALDPNAILEGPYTHQEQANHP